MVLFTLAGGFQIQVVNLVQTHTPRVFLQYLLLGIWVILLTLAVISALGSRKKQDAIALLFPLGVLLFFILRRNVTAYQLTVFQLMVIGGLLALENRGRGIYPAWLYLLFFSFWLEWIQDLFQREIFFFLDFIIHVLICSAVFITVSKIRSRGGSAFVSPFR